MNGLYSLYILKNIYRTSHCLLITIVDVGHTAVNKTESQFYSHVAYVLVINKTAVDSPLYHLTVVWPWETYFTLVVDPQPPELRNVDNTIYLIELLWGFGEEKNTKCLVECLALIDIQ